MKAKNILLTALPLLLSMSSCGDFLDEFSQDQIKPATTNDLEQLMYSDAYPYRLIVENFDLLTDDVQNNPVAEDVHGNPSPDGLITSDNGRGMFTFQPDMFDGNFSMPATANAYLIYYTRIKGCNVVMDNLESVSGTRQELDALLGQSLFLRAYYHLRLVTLYAQPYNAAGLDPETAPGVPLLLSSVVRDGGVSRATLKETYDQIETDLLQALDLLTESYDPPNAFRVGKYAAMALLTRFYTYRGLPGDADKVIQYADAVLQSRGDLTPLVQFVTSNNRPVFNRAIFDARNAEVLWVYGANPSRQLASQSFFPRPDAIFAPSFVVSSDVLNLYEDGEDDQDLGDIRRVFYIRNYTRYSDGQVLPHRSAKAAINGVTGDRGIRTAEIYLNRAEAYLNRFIQTGSEVDRAHALQDINDLRRNRFDTRNRPYVPVDIADADGLIRFYREERRRELVLEGGFRWIDIKRWSIEVHHTYTPYGGARTTHVLPPHSLLYALPIPRDAFDFNPQLVQNPR